METLTTHLSGGSDALVGDLAGEEIIRESTDPEPDPAESKCGGSTCTVLIRVILTPCVMMMVTSGRMRVFPGVTLHSFPAFRCFVNMKSGDRVTLVH